MKNHVLDGNKACGVTKIQGLLFRPCMTWDKHIPLQPQF